MPEKIGKPLEEWKEVEKELIDWPKEV